MSSFGSYIYIGNYEPSAVDFSLTFIEKPYRTAHGLPLPRDSTAKFMSLLNLHDFIRCIILLDDKISEFEEMGKIKASPCHCEE